ncbi:MAG: hypothetical protein R6W72_14785 [Desulfurivibrionaceae bacterium]
MKGKLLGHLLLPALPVLIFIILAAMPVEVVGCRLRGLLAAGIALAGAMGGVVAAGKGLFEQIRNRPGSGWWLATGVVLALPAIYLVFLAI